MEQLNKKCRICQIEKPLERFQFRKDKQIFRTECKNCQTKQSNLRPSAIQWRKKNKQRHKKYDLKRFYGMSLEQFENMKKAQNNKCLICCKVFKSPHVDHCHVTGKIRGLLCNLCNVGLGAFKDNLVSLQNAINYLKK